MLHLRLDEDGGSEELQEMLNRIKSYRVRVAEIARGIRNLKIRSKGTEGMVKHKVSSII